MKNKRLLLYLLALMMLVALVACTNNTSTGSIDQGQTDLEEKDQQGQGLEAEADLESPVEISYGIMTGPTAVGSINLLEKSKAGQSKFILKETITGTPDEIVANLIKGDLDMAVVPANLAAVLFNKTEGKIKLLASNNLGVLSILEVGNEVKSIEDLRGKTILSAGKNATPDIILNYILTKNGLVQDKDYQVEFKTEATEVVKDLEAGLGTIAILPEPMASILLTKNPDARLAIDLNEQWAKLNDSPQFTGVLVARSEFLEDFDTEGFLKEYEASINEAKGNVEGTANLLEKYNIFKAPIAKKSIPNMNLAYMDKEELQAAMDNYLSILFEAQEKFIGGKQVSEEFYYLGK
ncbi:MAG: hypothetical protein Q4E36_05325 [Bacillota bacterium]|nr:hypothetical protein [Bacillota bacterium]